MTGGGHDGCHDNPGRLVWPGPGADRRGHGVASPRTRLYDRNRKKDVYQDFGIPAYWIVELSRDHPELTVFELRSGAYEQTAHVIGGEEYRAAVPFPVTIVPSQLVTAK